tara:strand:+ start:6879 stop:7085 length:207 start_codon:yes stop_codon:yes gene_type:complete
MQLPEIHGTIRKVKQNSWMYLCNDISPRITLIQLIVTPLFVKIEINMITEKRFSDWFSEAFTPCSICG